jgi:hypothetical protein
LFDPTHRLTPAEFEQAYQICAKGVPLKGSFYSPFSALQSPDAYDNHLAVNSNLASIKAESAKEEEKLFHIHLPRFLVYFNSGLLLNLIQWAVWKGKGCICIYRANGPDGADIRSSTNTFIQSPLAGDSDTYPQVYSATAFMRHLEHLWGMRITFTIADILQHCDDNNAAFRRLLYTPELAIAFADVFGIFLLIPAGQVFRSPSVPSYFSLLSNISAYIMATCVDLITGSPMHQSTKDMMQ